MITPAGARVRPNPFWTPLRLVLLVAAIVATLGMVWKAPCATDDGGRWFSTKPVAGGAAYAHLCASELPAEYAKTGLAEGVVPWSTDGGRWPKDTVSVPVGLLQTGTAAVVRTVMHADVDARASRDASVVARSHEVRREAVAYTGLASLVGIALFLLALAALGSAASRTDALLLWPRRRRRTLALMPLAASPALFLLVGVGWDLVAVSLVMLGLAAWVRGRPVLAGILLGLACATLWWPLAVVVALCGTALLGRPREVGRMGLATLGVLFLVGIPALATTGSAAVLAPLRRWLTTDPVGSVWALAAELGLEPEQRVLSAVVIGAIAFVGSVLFIYAARSDDLEETARYAFVGLAAVLLIGPSYRPGYALWLLPLAVLARPVWRDVLFWQASEVFLAVATWWHLGQSTQPLEGRPDPVYVVAIALHVVVTVWFALRMLVPGGPGVSDGPGDDRTVTTSEETRVPDALRR